MPILHMKTKLRKLTNEEIKGIISRKNVNSKIVEKFLIRSVKIGDVDTIMRKLDDDIKKYRFNKETIEAIIDGLVLITGGFKTEINDY